MGAYKFIKKTAILVVGGTVLIIGIILIPLPGPGLLVTAGGLLILSTEFTWAERQLEKVKQRIENLVKAPKRAPNGKHKNHKK